MRGRPVCGPVLPSHLRGRPPNSDGAERIGPLNRPKPLGEAGASVVRRNDLPALEKGCYGCQHKGPPAPGICFRIFDARSASAKFEKRAPERATGSCCPTNLHQFASYFPSLTNPGSAHPAVDGRRAGEGEPHLVPKPLGCGLAQLLLHQCLHILHFSCFTDRQCMELRTRVLTLTLFEGRTTLAG